jgi:hypothetical protein
MSLEFDFIFSLKLIPIPPFDFLFPEAPWSVINVLRRRIPFDLRREPQNICLKADLKLGQNREYRTGLTHELA